MPKIPNQINHMFNALKPTELIMQNSNLDFLFYFSLR